MNPRCERSVRSNGAPGPTWTSPLPLVSTSMPSRGPWTTSLRKRWRSSCVTDVHSAHRRRPGDRTFHSHRPRTRASPTTHSAIERYRPNEFESSNAGGRFTRVPRRRQGLVADAESFGPPRKQPHRPLTRTARNGGRLAFGFDGRDSPIPVRRPRCRPQRSPVRRRGSGRCRPGACTGGPGRSTVPP